MTDFSTMTDAEIRQFKSGQQGDIRAARAEMAAAQVALEAKRAAEEARWARCVALATRLVDDRFSDEHTRVAERLRAGSDVELEAAEVATSAAVTGIGGPESTSIAGTSAEGQA